MKIFYKPPHGSKAVGIFNSSFVSPADGFTLNVEGGTLANGIDQKGHIQGVVKLDGVLVENAIVRLYLERDSSFLGEVITDNVGYFRFDGLNTSELFTIKVVDSLKTYEYIISSRRQPVTTP